MPLLVDGHNLIGQMPQISLADPNDEERLVLLLRRYATARRGRQVVVVFDHGVYGHPADLNGYGVTCVFARSPRDADAELVRRIRSLPHPREWTLVTSDRAVAQAARERGVRVVPSHVFAAQLLDGAAPNRPPAAPADERRDAPLSDAELRDWLRAFGEEE